MMTYVCPTRIKRTSANRAEITFQNADTIKLRRAWQLHKEPYFVDGDVNPYLNGKY